MLFFIVTTVHHRMLLNIMISNDSIVLFMNLAPESPIFLRVYKVLGIVICNVAKHCFTKGFLGLFGGTLGRPGEPPGPVRTFHVWHPAPGGHLTIK